MIYTLPIEAGKLERKRGCDIINGSRNKPIEAKEDL
jgi:hypothetical protein